MCFSGWWGTQLVGSSGRGLLWFWSWKRGACQDPGCRLRYASSVLGLGLGLRAQAERWLSLRGGLTTNTSGFPLDPQQTVPWLLLGSVLGLHTVVFFFFKATEPLPITSHKEC